MNKPKKNATDKKQDLVQEPSTEYKTNFEDKLDPSNTDEQEILLQQLLAIGLEQSKMGLGRPHEEVWAEMKLKYNFK